MKQCNVVLITVCWVQLEAGYGVPNLVVAIAGLCNVFSWIIINNCSIYLLLRTVFTLLPYNALFYVIG
jgi:hypothetical protein